jgi:aminoglycoside phosphotransferase (APT) family kinase protein
LRKIIERDYVFQTFIEGERWSDIEGDLTPEETIDLWRQCGEITKRIHCTTGHQFGHPYPGQQFAKWSETILNRFSRIVRSMLDRQLDTSTFSSIFDVVCANTPLFDEIKIPHLLHGDLWTFNLLVRRKGKKPTIVGVLDADRAWWGDPLADWIMFLLNIRRQEPEWQQPLSAFFDGYGKPDDRAAAQFRQEIYIAMHIGTCAVASARNGNEEDIARAYRDLGEIARSLPAL